MGMGWGRGRGWGWGWRWGWGCDGEGEITRVDIVSPSTDWVSEDDSTPCCHKMHSLLGNVPKLHEFFLVYNHNHGDGDGDGGGGDGYGYGDSYVDGLPIPEMQQS